MTIEVRDGVAQDLAAFRLDQRIEERCLRQVLSFTRGVDRQRLGIDAVDLHHDVEKITKDTFLEHISVHSEVPTGLWRVIPRSSPRGVSIPRGGGVHGAETVAVYARCGDESVAVLTDMMMSMIDGPRTICVLRKKMQPFAPLPPAD